VLAFSQGVYDTLKFVHILAAIVWVGAGLYFQFQATRLNRIGDPERIAAFTRDIEHAGKRLLLPASILVLVVGIVMVLYAPFLEFEDTWIALGLIGSIATAITGSLVVGPTAGKLGVLIGSEGASSPQVAMLTKRIFTVSRIDQVVLLAVIAAMVFKPGA
jgi:uncharacterized membrane protein